jgi:hypothetical protein
MSANQAVRLSVELVVCLSYATAVAQTSEINACDDSLAIPAILVPVPSQCRADNSPPGTSLELNLKLSLSSFSAPGPSIHVGTATFSWEDPSSRTDLLNDEAKIKVVSDCQNVPINQAPNVIIDVDTAFGPQLSAWQRGLADQEEWRPLRVVRVTTSWRLMPSGSNAVDLGTNEISYSARACAKHAQFPPFATDGRAVVSRRIGTNQTIVHQAFRSDPDSSTLLLGQPDLSQIVIYPQGQAVLINPDEIQTVSRPRFPVRLAFWVLDGATTPADIDREFDEMVAIHDHASSGIEFQKASFRDLSNDQAVLDLWERVCSIDAAALSGVCGLAQPVVTCSKRKCLPGCDTIAWKELAEMTLSADGARPFDPQAINIYYVPNIGALNSAVACGERPPPTGCMELKPTAANALLMSNAVTSFPGRLGHEIGHILGMGHPYNSPICADSALDNTFFRNLMMIENGVAGTDLSLGQVFQSHTTPKSWLWRQLNALPSDSPYRLPSGMTNPCPMASSSSLGVCIPLYLDVEDKR